MIVSLLLPSLLAGLLIAISAGALGCFVVWRRMAFFSDALAHSAILGTAVALLCNVHILIGLLGYGLLVAFILSRFDQKLSVDGDTLLAIIAQSSLALGVLLLPLAGETVDIESLLFGDILAINWFEVAVAALVSSLIVGLLAIKHRELVDCAIDEELAATEGIAVERSKLMLFCMMVALIAVAINVVGVLLIGALLLIPALTARQFAQTPVQMLLYAPIAGILMVLLGLIVAWFADLAAGPAIVVCATAVWVLSLLRSK